MSVGEIFVHFDPPKSGSRIVIYEGSCVLITIPRKKTMDRAGAAATAATSVRESRSIVKYDVRGTFASGRFLEFATLTGARTPLFRKWWSSGMQKVPFCLRAVAVFGCGA